MSVHVFYLSDRSTAVPGTLGDAAILFTGKDFAALAEVVDMVVKDRAMHDRIIVRQQERVQYFLEPQVKVRFQNYLAGLGLL